ncbi:MAG: iron ABC transporter permease [Rhodospirillales bacterium]
MSFLAAILPRPAGGVLAPLVVLLACAILAALNAGATGVGPADLARLLSAALSGVPHPELASAHLIIVEIRLPRAVLAALVGAALGVSGAIAQGLFRNPLADPGIIGVSAGAALAAALVILAGDTLLPFAGGLGASAWGRWAVPIAGLAGSAATTALLYVFATRRGVTSVATVLLGGVALSAFAGALTGLLIFSADDRQLRDFTFWTLGSLAGASWAKIAVLAPFLAFAAWGAARLADPLNLLLLGEAEAFHMGARVQQAKYLAIAVVASAVGTSVSVVGPIAFIGMLVPHLVRMVAGPDHRIVLPGSALLGASLLLAADTLARVVAAPAELPVGIITAAIGAPCFFWLLLRRPAEMA